MTGLGQSSRGASPPPHADNDAVWRRFPVRLFFFRASKGPDASTKKGPVAMGEQGLLSVGGFGLQAACF